PEGPGGQDGSSSPAGKSGMMTANAASRGRTLWREMVMTAAVSELLTWLTGGSAPAVLIKVFLAVCALVLGLLYRRYLGILGADRRRPAERQAYDAVRDSLAEGNMAARLYALWLKRFLDWVEGFFGDAG